MFLNSPVCTHNQKPMHNSAYSQHIQDQQLTFTMITVCFKKNRTLSTSYQQQSEKQHICLCLFFNRKGEFNKNWKDKSENNETDYLEQGGTECRKDEGKRCTSLSMPSRQQTDLCSCLAVAIVIQALSCVPLLVTPWTGAHQAPLSTGFPRQEYWSGLTFPSPGDLPHPGIKPTSPALEGRFFIAEPPGNPS